MSTVRIRLIALLLFHKKQNAHCPDSPGRSASLALTLNLFAWSLCFSLRCSSSLMSSLIEYAEATLSILG